MKESHVFDAELHEPGSAAARGECSYHSGECGSPAVVSYEDDDGGWQSGCAGALEELVEAGKIEPLGQGA